MLIFVKSLKILIFVFFLDLEMPSWFPWDLNVELVEDADDFSERELIQKSNYDINDFFFHSPAIYTDVL